MAASPIITMGFGSFGSVYLLPTLGFGDVGSTLIGLTPETVNVKVLGPRTLNVSIDGPRTVEVNYG